MLDEKDLEEIKGMIAESNRQVSGIIENAVRKGVHSEKSIPTKESILAIRDPLKRQKMIAENMELFRN